MHACGVLFYGDFMTEMKRTASFLLATALFVYCIFHSETVSRLSYEYLMLCTRAVVPSLFVFSVLTRIICYDKLFFKLCALFPRAGAEGMLLLAGILGGFPLGASVSRGLYDSGHITKKQAEYLCAFTNNPSLTFMISYAGVQLGSPFYGAVMALICFFSAIICALVCRTFLPKSERRILPPAVSLPRRGLGGAINDSLRSMAAICGCVVFFGCIGGLLPEGTPILVRGIAEITGGIAVCSSAVDIAVLLGFSGLSVMFQVTAVSGGRLSLKPYLMSKLLQSALMGGFAYILFDIVGI